MTSVNDLMIIALHVLSAYYPPAAKELQTAAENYRSRVTRLIDHIKRTESVRTPIPVYDVKTFLGRVLPELFKARRYEELAFASGAPGAVDTAKRPTLGEEVHAVVEAWAGSCHASDALIALQAATKGDLAAELLAVEKGLAKFDTPFPERAYTSEFENNTHSGWAKRSDMLLIQINGLLAKKRDLLARIENLAADGQAKPRKAAAFVGKAIDAAGGKEFITSRIREAALIRGVYWSSDPAGVDLTTAEGLLARCTAALANLGTEAADPAPDSYGAKLTAQRKEVADQVDRIKAEIDGRRRAGIAALIEKACSGDVDARDAIRTESASYTRAFPESFSASLDFVTPAINFDALAVELVKLVPENERDVVEYKPR